MYSGNLVSFTGRFTMVFSIYYSGSTYKLKEYICSFVNYQKINSEWSILWWAKYIVAHRTKQQAFIPYKHISGHIQFIKKQYEMLKSDIETKRKC